MNFSVIKEITYKLNKFSLPLIFNNFLNMMFSSILFSIIGRTSIQTIASTEVIDGFFYTFIGILGVATLAFNMSVSKVDADTRDFYDYFKSIFTLNFAIGLLSIVVCIISSPFVLSKFYNFEGRVLLIGGIYANIQSVSILLNLVIFSMSNLMKVRKMTKYIFYTGIISSIFQILITYVLVNVIDKDYSVIAIAIGSISSLIIQVVSYAFCLKNDFAHALKLKSGKKTELLKKSIPLVFQEILEGGIFQIMVISLISKLGYVTLSSYALSTRMTGIALTPMYMYCNALIIFVGEYVRGKKPYNLKILPLITIVLTLSFYILASLIFLIGKGYFIGLFTNIEEVSAYSSEILGFILIFSSFQIFFENAKYALQSLGHLSEVLKITFLINAISILILYAISGTGILSIYLIVLVISCAYLMLGMIFYVIYFRAVDKIT